MHSLRQQDDLAWEVGLYEPVTYSNPLFGPREVKKWRTIVVGLTFDAALNLVRMLNGGVHYAPDDTYAENPPHGAKGHRLSRNCDQCVENAS